MAGRPRVFDEQAVIDRAIDVFWMKGYEAASADELLAAMNMGKGSFYLAFRGGKKELYERSLEQFNRVAMKKFEADLAKSNDKILFIRNFFLSLATSSKNRQMKGCYLGNALVEMAGQDAPLQKKAAHLLGVLEDHFLDIIRQAQQEGKLKTKEKPETLARHLINLWNGINITRRMHPSDPGLEAMIQLNLSVLH
ncbi:TetR/AcrR family transcriptional regulator [Chitinophaga sp. XS-30]|uniref:TetR/AcrR family transcriptional regulator n=1 Tax=Chitinophaga sp. XS-30 TaxID=2604421 RepID=UPI0011DD76BE|nr:TetR/AcrR family transcriptional regulator [Chitinophaga sp. XS-30]QEH43028.1 TetR/AcrR family transcriptional regulator [Chitinophaga sp. XS-30]